jgi:hypothetical protein
VRQALWDLGAAGELMDLNRADATPENSILAVEFGAMLALGLLLSCC